jgi:hypothetical protein
MHIVNSGTGVNQSNAADTKAVLYQHKKVACAQYQNPCRTIIFGYKS